HRCTHAGADTVPCRCMVRPGRIPLDSAESESERRATMYPEYRKPLTTDQKVGGSSPSGRALVATVGNGAISRETTGGAAPVSDPLTAVGAHTSAHKAQTTAEWWAAHPEEHQPRASRALGSMLLALVVGVAVGLAWALLTM